MNITRVLRSAFARSAGHEKSTSPPSGAIPRTWHPMASTGARRARLWIRPFQFYAATLARGPPLSFRTSNSRCVGSSSPSFPSTARASSSPERKGNVDTPIFEKAIHRLVDTLRDELRRLCTQVDGLRLELQKQRLTERARRLQAELGFRGDLGWQCLRCGEDFRSLRDAETHLFLSSHCRKCGRAVPEASSAAASALCEFCSSAFMQARLKKRLGKRKAVSS